MKGKPISPKIVCSHKKRYPDEVTARAAVSVICENMKLDRQWVYKCDNCRGWHATSKKGSRVRKVTGEAMFFSKRRV